MQAEFRASPQTKAPVIPTDQDCHHQGNSTSASASSLGRAASFSLSATATAPIDPALLTPGLGVSALPELPILDRSDSTAAAVNLVMAPASASKPHRPKTNRSRRKSLDASSQLNPPKQPEPQHTLQQDQPNGERQQSKQESFPSATTTAKATPRQEHTKITRPRRRVRRAKFVCGGHTSHDEEDLPGSSTQPPQQHSESATSLTQSDLETASSDAASLTALGGRASSLAAGELVVESGSGRQGGSGTGGSNHRHHHHHPPHHHHHHHHRSRSHRTHTTHPHTSLATVHTSTSLPNQDQGGKNRSKELYRHRSGLSESIQDHDHTFDSKDESSQQLEKHSCGEAPDEAGEKSRTEPISVTVAVALETMPGEEGTRHAKDISVPPPDSGKQSSMEMTGESAAVPQSPPPPQQQPQPQPQPLHSHPHPHPHPRRSHHPSEQPLAPASSLQLTQFPEPTIRGTTKDGHELPVLCLAQTASSSTTEVVSSTSVAPPRPSSVHASSSSSTTRISAEPASTVSTTPPAPAITSQRLSRLLNPSLSTTSLPSLTKVTPQPVLTLRSGSMGPTTSIPTPSTTAEMSHPPHLQGSPPQMQRVERTKNRGSPASTSSAAATLASRVLDADVATGSVGIARSRSESGLPSRGLSGSMATATERGPPSQGHHSQPPVVVRRRPSSVHSHSSVISSLQQQQQQQQQQQSRQSNKEGQYLVSRFLPVSAIGGTGIGSALATSAPRLGSTPTTPTAAVASQRRRLPASLRMTVDNPPSDSTATATVMVAEQHQHQQQQSRSLSHDRDESPGPYSGAGTAPTSPSSTTSDHMPGLAIHTNSPSGSSSGPLGSSSGGYSTRTQQKLWLQRESSHDDLDEEQMARRERLQREMERIHREYRGIRLIYDPLIESLARCAAVAAVREREGLSTHPVTRANSGTGTILGTQLTMSPQL